MNGDRRLSQEEYRIDGNVSQDERAKRSSTVDGRQSGRITGTPDDELKRIRAATGQVVERIKLRESKDHIVIHTLEGKYRIRPHDYKSCCITEGFDLRRTWSIKQSATKGDALSELINELSIPD